MVRSIRAPIFVALLGTLAGACSQSQTEVAFRMPTQPRGVTCDTASATVMTFGRSTARLYSEVALKHQISELRGYMFNSGLRRIRIVRTDNSCADAGSRVALNGLAECKARAQLCGR
jgi:hypothetical protein